MMTSDKDYTTRKNRKKFLWVIIQLLFIFDVVFIVTLSLLTVKDYVGYTHQAPRIAGDKGFVALSYFGVDRVGNQTLIGSERLHAHLQALKDNGYVTVTQQDILDYCQSKKDLPEKSLFLIFEDGRRDTAIFSQKILEELNYKATMLTYADKFSLKDPKFLMPDELKGLEKSTFWELGTNGYRLAFINVFDRHNNYLGELDPLEHISVAPYLKRKYNHYLMDFIRDENWIPKESYSKMKDRITYDYEAMRDVYSKSVGYLPGMYILMHSNTGSFGNNDKVSAVNEQWIKELFKMNFNREGFSFNKRNSSIYDLTRMQPQAYWSTNHLLMRIKYDNFQDFDFVKGDLGRQKSWDPLKGALEIQTDTLILTSLPKDKGLIRLKNSSDFDDLNLSVRLRGNKLGLQRVYVRADDNLGRFLAVSVFNNYLYVTEKTGAAEKELFKLNLDRHDGIPRLSIPEDKKAAEIRELETFLKYADSVEKAKIYARRLSEKQLEKVPSVAEGAPEYIPEISVHAKGDRVLTLSLKRDRLSVAIDGKEAVKDLQVTNGKAGSVYLESAWGEYGWSQRNLADDVYDGVFEKLIITENTGKEKENVLFDSSPQGYEAAALKAKQYWLALVNWFVTNL